MKQLLFPILVAIACMATSPAYAKPYLSGAVGDGALVNSYTTVPGVTVKNADTFASGFPVFGAVGIKSNAYRVEVALGKQTNDMETVIKNSSGATFTSVPATASRGSVLSCMINNYYDFDFNSLTAIAKPYLAFGFGGARINMKSSTVDETNTVFAWQIGGGVGLKAADNFTIDLGYRFFKPSDFSSTVKLNNGTTEKGNFVFLSYNFQAGIRYEFN